MQVLKKLWTRNETSKVRNTYQCVLDLRNRLKETYRQAKESLYKAQGEQEHLYDKKTKNRQFKDRDEVLVLLPTDHNKLHCRVTYMVKEVINRMNYKVDVTLKEIKT